jgi:hypothetical protein
MKQRLKVIAIATLLCGLAAAGFAAWSYFHARTQDELWPDSQKKSFELERQSDKVKGTPEENRLMNEAHASERAASETLASAKSNSQRAVIFGIGSILLILISIASMIAHIKSTEAD